MQRIGHDRRRRTGVDEAAEVHLPEGNDKARVDRQQQEKIEFSGADEFGKIGAIDEEECLEDLLDEMARADEHHDLPFGPGADVVRVQIEHADETQLQSEPKHSTTIHSRKFPLNIVSRVTEFFQSAE